MKTNAFALTDDDARLLSEADPPPFHDLNAEAERPVLLLCDHAGRAVPHALGQLGLDAGALDLHVAWDVGAGALTTRLASRMNAPAILGNYSRLVIDLNRPPGSPTSVLAVSDGVPVPGNRALSDDARSRREKEIFHAYHNHVAGQLENYRRREITPTVIAIHSFTPHMNGFDRPWHIGILWEHDGRIAVPLITRLRERGDLHVGDNEPYSGHDPEGFTLRAHCEPSALPHVLIEVRQDLVDTPEGVARWAELLQEAIDDVLSVTGSPAPDGAARNA